MPQCSTDPPELLSDSRCTPSEGIMPCRTGAPHWLQLRKVQGILYPPSV